MRLHIVGGPVQYCVVIVSPVYSDCWRGLDLRTGNLHHICSQIIDACLAVFSRAQVAFGNSIDAIPRHHPRASHSGRILCCARPSAVRRRFNLPEAGFGPRAAPAPPSTSSPARPSSTCSSPTTGARLSAALPAPDFNVEEDNKPQPIRSFYEVEKTRRPHPRARSRRIPTPTPPPCPPAAPSKSSISISRAYAAFRLVATPSPPPLWAMSSCAPKSTSRLPVDHARRDQGRGLCFPLRLTACTYSRDLPPMENRPPKAVDDLVIRSAARPQTAIPLPPPTRSPRTLPASPVARI